MPTASRWQMGGEGNRIHTHLTEQSGCVVWGQRQAVQLNNSVEVIFAGAAGGRCAEGECVAMVCKDR